MPSLFAPDLENSYQQSLCCVLCESIYTFQLREEYILENGRDNTSSTSRMSNFDVFLKRRIRKDNAETFFPLASSYDYIMPSVSAYVCSLTPSKIHDGL
jgi:hypothetical protein